MIIPGLRQLFSPLNYLRMYGNNVKSWYDWKIPMLFTFLSILPMVVFEWSPEVFSEKGLVSQGTELLKMLIGFYIASLAAVSTFPSSVMDQKIAGKGLTLDVKRQGRKLTIPLSRRRMLSYLFGYLSFISILVFIAGVICILLADDIKRIFPFYLHEYIKLLGVSMYLFLFYNILVTTLLGLHYLTERIHRPVDGNTTDSPD